MNRSDFFSGIYALAVIILGWGTVAMHGSLTSMGGFLDVSSMYLWVSFCVCYSFIRLARRGALVFLALYAGLSAWLIFTPLNVERTFGLLIASSVLMEGAYWAINRKRVRFEKKWAVYTAVSFSTAFGVWNLSLEGRPFYYPDTLLQGHAVWHILCAVATWTIYRYYRSEEPLASSPGAASAQPSGLAGRP